MVRRQALACGRPVDPPYKYYGAHPIPLYTDAIKGLTYGLKLPAAPGLLVVRRDPEAGVDIVSHPARLLVFIASLALVPAALAIPITWTSENTTSQYVAAGATITFTHDLAAEGFIVGEDVVTDFLLTAHLSDDVDDASAPLEIAFLDLPGAIGSDFLFGFSGSSGSFSGFSVLGLLEINLLGTLTVSIRSVSGDFRFDRSVLVANGTTERVALAEPSTLALFGIGLLLLAWSSRYIEKGMRILRRHL
ncbi:MAG TPA: hypothetical protein VJQ52_01840 [Steroidobacteraceae bacterium]|nr:hypothetical protein [Steroidobacteraceae bacterium]